MCGGGGGGGGGGGRSLRSGRTFARVRYMYVHTWPLYSRTLKINFTFEGNHYTPGRGKVVPRK